MVALALPVIMHKKTNDMFKAFHGGDKSNIHILFILSQSQSSPNGWFMYNL